MLMFCVQAMWVDPPAASTEPETFLLSDEDCLCIDFRTLGLGELRVLPLRGGVWGYVMTNWGCGEKRR